MATVPASLSAPRSSRLSLRSGAAIVLTLRFVAAGAMLALQLVLARTLGVTGLGAYVIAIAWVQAMAVFGRAGLENTSLRHVAEHRTRDEPELLAGFMTWSRRASLVASLLSAALLVVLTLVFIAPNDPITRPALLLGALALPLLTTRQIQEARLRAVHHVWQSMIGPALWPALLTVCVLIAVSLCGWEATAAGTIGLLVAVLAVCSLITFGFVRRSPTAALTSDVRQTVWRRTALTFLAFDAVILLRGRTSVIIAGMMIDTETAGIFAVAEKFAEVVGLGVVSINMFAAPHFASLYAAGQRAELRDLIKGSQQLGLLFAVPVALMLALLGRPLLGLLDEAYVVGYPLMVMMLASVTIGSLAGPAAYVLAMSGKERITLNGAILCMVINLSLSFTLAPLYGATGLAVTHLVTMIVWTGYMLWHLRKFLRAL